MIREFYIRYLQGLITNKRLGKAMWLDPKVIEDKTARDIMAVLVDLNDKGSAMTPEVVESRLTPVFGTCEAAREFLAEAFTRKVTAAQVRELHGIIVDKHIRRESAKVFEYLAKHVEDPIAIDRGMFSLRQLKALQPIRMESLGNQAATALEDTFNASSYIVPWPLRTMRKFWLGMTRKELVVVAGRPGTGKTTLSTWLAWQWVKAGYKVCVFEKEMPAARVIQKIILDMTGPDITGDTIRNGNLTDDQRQEITKATEEFVRLAQENFLLYDDIYTVSEMEAVIAKHRPDIVIDDFIQFTDMSGLDGNRSDQIRQVAATYKHIAKEYNCAFLVLAQMNRTVEQRDDHRPRQSDLAESGALEQIAADIVFLHWEHKYDRNVPKDELEILYEKARYGEIMGVKVQWDRPKCSYNDFAGPAAIIEQLGEDNG